MPRKKMPSLFPKTLYVSTDKSRDGSDLLYASGTLFDVADDSGETCDVAEYALVRVRRVRKVAEVEG